MRKAKANILVVEDDPALMRGLVDVLIFQGYHAEGAPDGEEGLKLAMAGGFDLILLDVMLPNMDGFSVCRALRAERPNQPVIILTAKGSESDVLQGFEAGADDYVTKPFSLQELMARVEALLRRSGRLTGDVELTSHGVSFQLDRLLARRGDSQAELTRKEADILVYLYRRQGQTVSRKELLEEVWGYASGDVETRTVDIHMQKLRKKLYSLFPDQEPPVFIATIRGEGFRLEREGDE